MWYFGFNYFKLLNTGQNYADNFIVDISFYLQVSLS